MASTPAGTEFAYLKEKFSLSIVGYLAWERQTSFPKTKPYEYTEYEYHTAFDIREVVTACDDAATHYELGPGCGPSRRI